MIASRTSVTLATSGQNVGGSVWTVTALKMRRGPEYVCSRQRCMVGLPDGVDVAQLWDQTMLLDERLEGFGLEDRRAEKR